MDRRNIFRLILLSAIWGGSFIFMRILAPILGPVLTASLRTLIAGLFLIIIFRIQDYTIHWKRDYKELLIIGIINSAIPFYLFSYAALHIPASLSNVLNSTTPMVGALLAATLSIEALSMRKGIGLISGIFGVAVITTLTVDGVGLSFYLSVGACLLAATCYSINSIYVKLKASHIEPKAIAAGSQLFAGLALLPFTMFNPVTVHITWNLVITIISFAVICSALAYLLFFELLKNVGPTKALTVTFLVPIFGITWAALLLKEPITIFTLIGGSIILFGTYLVTSTK